MPNDVPQITRFGAAQTKEIAAVRSLRNSANALRSKVSLGSYDDNDLILFWKLSDSAGNILFISNPELASRAGLGSGFFSTVAKQHRRPKLVNFLRALTAIIDTADERLYDVDGAGVFAADGNTKSNSSNIRLDTPDLFLLASSLAQIARNEIQNLDQLRPNDPETIANNKKQRNLLVLFAEGFERIASALEKLSQDTSRPIFLKKAKGAIDAVSTQINEWWEKNSAEAVDWGVRLPVLAAGVGLLGLAGANMPVATTAVAAMVGGPKVLEILKKRPKLTKQTSRKRK